MTDRIKDLFDAYTAGRVSRRELMRGAARLGLTAASANLPVGAAPRCHGRRLSTAGEKGTAISFCRQASLCRRDDRRLENFKKLTGIEVSYDVFPEDVYFDKVTAALSSKSTISTMPS